MNTRTESEITIYSSRRRPIVTVPIRKESKRVWKLMDSDYIELRFDLAEPVVIGLGAYIDDELFGRFVVCEEQACTINKSNGAYQYTVQFYNRYYYLNNYVLCFCHVRENTIDNYYRKETDWSLTDTIGAQLNEVMKNITAIGHSGYSYVVHAADIEKSSEALLMQYSGTHIIDALNSIANTWECEWWADTNDDGVVFHFGKCQSGATPITLEQGVNCENITVDRSSTSHANRVWSFGGTQNVPPTYKRKLWLEVTKQKTVPNFGQLSFDSVREMLPQMFTNPQRVPIYRVDIDTGPVREVSVHGQGATTYTLDFPVVTQPITEDTNIITMIEGGQYDFDIFINKGLSINFAYNVWRADKSIKFTDTITLYVKVGGVRVDTLWSRAVVRSFAISRNVSGYQVLSDNGDYTFSVTQNYDGYASGGSVERVRLKYEAKQSADFTLEVVRTLTATTPGRWYYEGIIGSNEQFTFTELGEVTGDVASYDTDTYAIPATDREGDAYTLIFNPASVGEAVDEYYAFKAQRNGAYVELSMGDQFLIAESELEYTEVPYSYYTDDIDDPSAIKRIGERRIELPSEYEDDECEIVDGYMQISGINDTTAKEEAIIFDDIYPRELLRVGEIATQKMETDTEPMSDGSIYTWQWTQYTITPSEMFAIKASWLLPNVDLQVKFLTRADAVAINPDWQDEGAEYHLAGMTFNVNLIDDDPDTDNSRYTIVRNENYGAKLPNEYLRPAIGDPFIVLGWNVRAMGATGLVEAAEQAVARKTAEYLREVRFKQFTFTCDLMSDTLLNDDGTFELLEAGSAATVKYDAASQGVQQLVTSDGMPFHTKTYQPFMLRAVGQTSRVIAYELKLDIPYDTPRYTIGESEAYSRLRQIEKQITKLQ